MNSHEGNSQDGRSLPLLLLALFLAICGIVNMVQQGDRSSGLDFYQLWAPARFVTTDGASMYRPESREVVHQKARREAGGSRGRQAFAASQRLNVNATPAILTLFSVASGDFEAAYSTFRVLALLAFIGALLLLGQALDVPMDLLFLLAAFTGTWFQPVGSDVWVGNVNRFQLLLLALFLLFQKGQFRGSRYCSGAILAVTVLLKPNLAFIVPLLLITWFNQARRRELMEELAGFSLAAAALVAYTSFRFGSVSTWLLWSRSLGGMPEDAIPVRMGNFAPSKLIAEAFGIHVEPLLALLFPFYALALLLFTRRGPEIPPGDRTAAVRSDTLTIGAGVLIYNLSAWMAWIHYVTLLLPLLLLFLSDRRAERRRQIQLLAAVALFALAIDPWAPLVGAAPASQALAVILTEAALLATVAWLQFSAWRSEPAAGGIRTAGEP